MPESVHIFQWLISSIHNHMAPTMLCVLHNERTAHLRIISLCTPAQNHVQRFVPQTRSLWITVLVTALVVILVGIGAGFGAGWGARASKDMSQSQVCARARKRHHGFSNNDISNKSKQQCRAIRLLCPLAMHLHTSLCVHVFGQTSVLR